MAVNTSRSLNGDLHYGMTDGKYRKNRPNVGGDDVSFDTTLATRADLPSQYGYGYIGDERHPQQLPDGSGACI
jgi:hypothetical protein